MAQEDERAMAAADAAMLAGVGVLLAGRPHGRVLDAGCGYGRLASRIAPLCGEYVGVDFAEIAIVEARKDAPPNATFHVGDIATWKDEKPFDLVFIAGVWVPLEHRQQQVWEHLQSLLAPDGVVALFDSRITPGPEFA